MYTAEWYIAKDNKPSDRGLINAQHLHSSEGKMETHEKLEPGWPVCGPRFELGTLKHKSARLPLCSTNNDEMGISRYGSRHSKPHPYREVVSFLLRSLSCVHILVKNLEEPSSLF